MLTLAAAAFALIGTGCDLSLNLFSGMGLPEYDVAEIKAKADSDPAGAVEDVQTMIDSGQVTDENRKEILEALDTAYIKAGDTKTQQKASLLSAQVEITGNEGSKTLVSNTSSVITDVLNSPDPSSMENDELIFSLTSGVRDSSDDELREMFETLKKASTDYSDFADLIGVDPELSDGEKGDLLIMATMTMVISDTYESLVEDDQQVLIDFIQGDASSDDLDIALGGYDPTSSFQEGADLMKIVEYADDGGDIYQTLSELGSGS